ncbi:hypothetical protein I6E29_00990 [Arcanobacterium haemolyticum]|nr:hypothetical protein [Arcanobacterium haemolyticum]
MKSRLTREEFEKLVEESGWIDGEWHSAAMINPMSGGYAEGRYPAPYMLDDTEMVEWVRLYEGGQVIGFLEWAGSPVTHLSTTDLRPGHELIPQCDELGLQGLPIEEARAWFLERFDHGSVERGTVSQMLDLEQRLYDDYEKARMAEL